MAPWLEDRARPDVDQMLGEPGDLFGQTELSGVADQQPSRSKSTRTEGAELGEGREGAGLIWGVGENQVDGVIWDLERADVRTSNGPARPVSAGRREIWFAAQPAFSHSSLGPAELDGAVGCLRTKAG